jgi:L-glyceraldehyde 3-phosphate reductase
LYAGVSSYSGERYCQSVDVVRDHDWAPITIHQPYYNMLSRGIETDLLPHTAMHGTGVIAFCPLAGGMLSDRYLGGLPPDSRWGKRGEEGRKWWEEQKAAGVWDRIGVLNAIAIERGQSLAQMAIAWILRLPSVTSALIGASGIKQVEDDLQALENLTFSDEELQRIDAALSQ